MKKLKTLHLWYEHIDTTNFMVQNRAFFIGGGAVTKRVRYVDEIRQSENGDFNENNSTPGKQ